MRIRTIIILAFVLVIAAFNSITVSAKPLEEEEDDPSFRECVKDFASNMKAVRKYMKAEKERRRQEWKDIELLAEVIYWENWYTDKEKEAAWLTGCVVLNRVNSADWPDTIHDVLYQRGQYSTTKKFYTQELPEEVYEMAADLIRNGTGDVPAGVVFQATFSQGKLYKKINGEYFCYGK